MPKKQPKPEPTPQRRPKKPKPPPPPPATIPPPPLNGKVDDLDRAFAAGRLDGRRPSQTADRLIYEEPTWLVPGLIPAGDVTLVAGKSGCGKSSMYSSLLAAVTTGAVAGEAGMRPESRAMLYAREENLRGPVLGRLRAAGAKLGRVILADEDDRGQPGRRMHLPDGAGDLSDLLAASHVSLLVIDPLRSYLSHGVSPMDGIAMRAVIEALQGIARRLSLTILTTTHFRKSRVGDVQDWISGVADLTQAARSIVAMGADPRDDTRRVICSVKCAQGGESGPRYYTVDREAGAVVWRLGPLTDMEPSDLAGIPLDAVDRSARSDARRYLIAALGVEEQRASQMILGCQAAGIAPRTLARARLDLGVTSHLVGPAGDQHWVWRRPAEWPPGTESEGEDATV